MIAYIEKYGKNFGYITENEVNSNGRKYFTFTIRKQEIK